MDTFPIHHSSRGVLVTTGRTLQLPRWNAREGHNIIYRPSGTKYLEGDYTKKNDTTFMRNGQFTLYNKDGSIREQGTFRNDEKVGLFRYNDSTGTPRYTMDFDCDYRTSLYPNGTKESEGRIATVSNTGREFRKGKWKFYCPDGSLSSQGKFNSWGQVGKWVYYNADGSIWRTEHHRRQRFRRHKVLNSPDIGYPCE